MRGCNWVIVTFAVATVESGYDLLGAQPNGSYHVPPHCINVSKYKEKIFGFVFLFSISEPCKWKSTFATCIY